MPPTLRLSTWDLTRRSELLFLGTRYGRRPLPEAVALRLGRLGRGRGRLAEGLTGDKEVSCCPSAPRQVVKEYPPGQQEIDGGGFDIKTVDAEKGYLYVQFESLKRGYIDDVEFVVKPTDQESGQVFVRSASRLGYLDLGVNAKRLNRISQALRDLPGGRWTAPKISGELFPRCAQDWKSCTVAGSCDMMLCQHVQDSSVERLWMPCPPSCQRYVSENR